MSQELKWKIILAEYTHAKTASRNS